MAKFLQRSPKRLAGTYCATTVRLLLSTVSFAAMPAGSVWAQNASWTNPGTGDWNTAGNWNPGIPSGGAAFIHNGGTAQIAGPTNESLTALSLGGGAGTSGNLVILSGVSLTAAGSMDVGNATGGTSVLTIDGGSFVQTGGSAWVSENGTVVLRNGGTIDVSGNGNGGTFGLSGGTLTIGDGGGTLTAGSIWGIGAAPSHVIFDNDTGSVSFATNIRNNVSVVHDGVGTTTLIGGKTYTGGTTLNAGVLSVSQNTNLGDAAGTLTFNGGTLQTTAGFSMNRATAIDVGGGTFDVGTGTLTQAGVISGSGPLNKTGVGTLTLTGNSAGFTGTTTVSDGTLRLAGLLGGNKEAEGTGVIEAAIANALNGGTHAFQQSSRLDALVAGAINGGTFRFFQSGTLNASATGAVGGSDIILTNVANLNANARHAVSNSTVNLDSNARVTLGANDALTADTHFTFTRVALDPNIGGTFNLNGYSTELGSISSGYSVGHGLGLITNDGSTDSVLTLSDAAASTTFSGVIQDGSGTLGLTLAAGALTLDNASNTYTGGTTVLGGTLTAGRTGAFVDSTAYAVNGGTLDLNGFDLAMSSLSGAGGTVTLGTADLTVDQAASTSYAGLFTGTGNLTKSGAGTLSLTGDSFGFSGGIGVYYRRWQTSRLFRLDSWSRS